jgi:hypothetical protein
MTGGMYAMDVYDVLFSYICTNQIHKPHIVDIRCRNLLFISLMYVKWIRIRARKSEQCSEWPESAIYSSSSAKIPFFFKSTLVIFVERRRKSGCVPAAFVSFDGL